MILEANQNQYLIVKKVVYSEFKRLAFHVRSPYFVGCEDRLAWNEKSELTIQR